DDDLVELELLYEILVEDTAVAVSEGLTGTEASSGYIHFDRLASLLEEHMIQSESESYPVETPPDQSRLCKSLSRSFSTLSIGRVKPLRTRSRGGGRMPVTDGSSDEGDGGVHTDLLSAGPSGIFMPVEKDAIGEESDDLAIPAGHMGAQRSRVGDPFPSDVTPWVRGRARRRAYPGTPQSKGNTLRELERQNLQLEIERLREYEQEHHQLLEEREEARSELDAAQHHLSRERERNQALQRRLEEAQNSFKELSNRNAAAERKSEALTIALRQ
ncbi:hypothetical protein KIPB_012481, partial [Kipferlia bialata]